MLNSMKAKITQKQFMELGDFCTKNGWSPISFAQMTANGVDIIN